jgi:dTDP-4-dehydrorhamnose 3,5-epimerase
VESIETGVIAGVRLLEPPLFPDGRGSFREIFRSSWFEGIFAGEVQINCTRSIPGVLRGLHYHTAQWDLWFPMEGSIRAALLDLRNGSPTRGASETLVMSGMQGRALLIPPGVAHGYLALDDCTLIYVVNSYYDGSDEFGVAWDDPETGIDWGTDSPVLSLRDSGNPPLKSAGPLALDRRNLQK